MSKGVARVAERPGHVTSRQLVDPAVHSCEGCFGRLPIDSKITGGAHGNESARGKADHARRVDARR